MEVQQEAGELKFSTMESGVQSVTTAGTPMMLELCVGCLATAEAQHMLKLAMAKVLFQYCWMMLDVMEANRHYSNARMQVGELKIVATVKMRVFRAVHKIIMNRLGARVLTVCK